MNEATLGLQFNRQATSLGFPDHPLQKNTTHHRRPNPANAKLVTTNTPPRTPKVALNWVCTLVSGVGDGVGLVAVGKGVGVADNEGVCCCAVAE